MSLAETARGGCGDRNLADCRRGCEERLKPASKRPQKPASLCPSVGFLPRNPPLPAPPPAGSPAERRENVLGDPAGETEPRGTNHPGKKIIIGIVIIIVITIKVIPISSVKHHIAIRPPPLSPPAYLRCCLALLPRVYWQRTGRGRNCLRVLFYFLGVQLLFIPSPLRSFSRGIPPPRPAQGRSCAQGARR